MCGFSRAARRTFPNRNHTAEKNQEVTIENQYECLLKRIAPYSHLPYGVELFLKQNISDRIIENIKYRLNSVGSGLPEFPVEEILPSPQVEEYRGKDDFTVFRGVDGYPTVGYLTGTPSLPGCFAVRPTHLPHIKESHKRLAWVFEEYVRKSHHKPCYFFSDGGFWKRITIRSNAAGDMMAVVVTHPYQISNTEMAEERDNLRDYFLSYEPKLILYHQECGKTDCTNDLDSYLQLAGERPFLIERMAGKLFQISPHSFFQINKKAAEQMVTTIWDGMKVTDETAFIDLYSGVGLHSIIGSDRVAKAVGIEILEAAVMDAENNALLNNITNCKFIAGRVETNLSKVLRTDLAEDSKLMTLVNPGRAGMTKKVVSHLRQENRVRNLVYVSCKPDHPYVLNNFVQLCRRGGHMRGNPFHIKRVQIFDLFPRTGHFEMVLEFAR